MTDAAIPVRRRRAQRKPEATAEAPDPLDIAIDAIRSGKEPKGAALKVLEKYAQLLDHQVASERLGLTLKLLTVGAGLAIAIGAGALVWSAASDRGLVVEPFQTPPMLVATMRGEARSISRILKNASGVSIMVMNLVWPTVMPRFSSSSLTSSSSNCTCDAPPTLVQASASTSGQIECSMSRTACDSGWLKRTTTSAPPRRTRAAAFSMSLRAAAFSEGGTLSSRSS